MVQLSVILDGTVQSSGPFDAANMIEVHEPVTIIGMPEGTVGGNPTVLIRAKLPGSNTDVFIETTLALFLQAAKLLQARYHPHE
jgi:hypothetical protein